MVDVATTSSPRSPRPVTPMAGRPRRSPTTGRSTPRASPGGATASSTCSPGSGSAGRTVPPLTLRPRARSSAITRRSSAGWRGDPRRPISPRCRDSSTRSERSTTSSGRTGRSAGGLPPSPMTPGPRPILAAAALPATSGSGTTRPTARARSPSAGRAGCTISTRASPMPAGASSRSPTSRRSPSSPSTPARSSPLTASSPTGATGATNDETPAAGRGPRRPADHRCHACRDACVTDVATQDMARPTGFERTLPTIVIDGIAPLVEALLAA